MNAELPTAAEITSSNVMVQDALHAYGTIQAIGQPFAPNPELTSWQAIGRGHITHINIPSELMDIAVGDKYYDPVAILADSSPDSDVAFKDNDDLLTSWMGAQY